VHFLGNRAYLRLAEGHCAALLVDRERAELRCSTYELRPVICRTLERGSAECLAERDAKLGRVKQALGALLGASV
jgi:uncharacterized protein